MAKDAILTWTDKRGKVRKTLVTVPDSWKVG